VQWSNPFGDLAAWSAPIVGLPDPDATLVAYFAVLARLRRWIGQLLADLERVNGPLTAQVLADGLKARLAELGHAELGNLCCD
jgi:hypothetical protein